MTAFVKQHRLVMKVAEIRAAVCSLQRIEVNGKAVVLKLGIENKAGASLQRRVSQGNVACEGILGVLATDLLDRPEPYLLPQLDQRGFVIRLDAMLPGEP